MNREDVLAKLGMARARTLTEAAVVLGLSYEETKSLLLYELGITLSHVRSETRRLLAGGFLHSSTSNTAPAVQNAVAAKIMAKPRGSIAARLYGVTHDELRLMSPERAALARKLLVEQAMRR